MWWLWLILWLGFLIFLSIKVAEDSEQQLFIKLIGYYILGSFSFKIGIFPLPVGFLAFSLGFFPPAINQKAKRWAVYYGLVGLFLGAVIPAANHYNTYRMREVTALADNFYQMSLSAEWEEVTRKAKLPDNLIMSTFECHFYADGSFCRLDFLAEKPMDNGLAVHYQVSLIPGEELIFRVEPIEISNFWGWYHSTHTLSVHSLFSMLDALDFNKIRPQGEYTDYLVYVWGTKQIINELHEEYYLISEEGIVPLHEDLLPYRSYSMSVQGLTNGSISVKSGVNAYSYLFDGYSFAHVLRDGQP